MLVPAYSRSEFWIFDFFELKTHKEFN
jgi:hypothetical protein